MKIPQHLWTSQRLCGAVSEVSSNSDNCEAPHSNDRPLSPPPYCAICLGPFETECFTDSCTHQFCFNCLCNWSHVKPQCPLCIRPIKTILYNVKSKDQLVEYRVQRLIIPFPHRPIQIPEEGTVSRNWRFILRLNKSPMGKFRVVHLISIGTKTFYNNLINRKIGRYFTIDLTQMESDAEENAEAAASNSQSAIIAPQNLPAPTVTANIELNSSSSDECVFVSERELLHSPDLISLNSDFDVDLDIVEEILSPGNVDTTKEIFNVGATTSTGLRQSTLRRMQALREAEMKTQQARRRRKMRAFSRGKRYESETDFTSTESDSDGYCAIRRKQRSKIEIQSENNKNISNYTASKNNSGKDMSKMLRGKEFESETEYASASTDSDSNNDEFYGKQCKLRSTFVKKEKNKNNKSSI